MKEQIINFLSNDLMYVFLGCLLIIVVTWLYNLHNSSNTKIDLADIVTEKGRLNGSKVFRFIAFLISSWGFVYLIVQNNLSEWYGISYLAVWTGNALLRNKFITEDQQKP